MKTIEDNEGTKYRLEDNRLLEVNSDAEYREVRKSDLRRAVKKADDSIDYRYTAELTKAGKFKNPESLSVDFFAGKGYVRLGCRTFYGKHAKALVRWATA